MSNQSLVIACAIAALALMACEQKTPAPAPKAATVGAPVAAKQPPPSHAAKQTATSEELASTHKRLAEIYLRSRCEQIGVLTPKPETYTKYGFKSGQAFRVAFHRAAAADALWARGVVAKAHASKCRDLEPRL